MPKEKEKSYLWRKVGDKEKEEIKKQAKKIMDDFASALEKVKVEAKEKEFALERPEQMREEKSAREKKEFRKRFLKQVPKKEDDWLLAEKGEWK